MAPVVVGWPPWSITNWVSVSLELPTASQVPSFLTRRYWPVCLDRIRTFSPNLAASSSPVVGETTNWVASDASEGATNLVLPSAPMQSSSPLLFLMWTGCPACITASGFKPSVPSRGSKFQNAFGSKAVPLPSATLCWTLLRKQPPFNLARRVIGLFSFTKGCSFFLTSASSTSVCKAAKRVTTDFLFSFSTRVLVTLIIFFFLPMTLAALSRKRSYHRAMADAAKKKMRFRGISRKKRYLLSFCVLGSSQSLDEAWSSCTRDFDFCNTSSRPRPKMKRVQFSAFGS
mmetsp:Transcript_52470/g.114522  ORF Transcript_52470/g.114522 Transcript_52470/m.114522 type:complete len:287 (+) Transcript_52470:1959-2819(+)